MTNGLWISLWRVGFVALIGLGSTLLLHWSVGRIEKQMEKSAMSGERLKRLKTMLHAGRSLGHILIALIVLLMILHEWGVNVTPVLASAGIVGLALSLSAQTLIQDFLGGAIILVENQFAIGDVITVGTLTGTVEQITLRATYLRDNEGKLYTIPNGEIRILANLTNQWAQVVVTFNFDEDADMERALGALEKASRQVQSDEELTAALLETPRVVGYTGFTDWAVQSQIIAKTRPGQQWLVGRRLRKAALECLQKEGIRMALPRQRVEKVE
ncbi:MAG: mechanosensitive ion channel family protein [Anaerolineae bacterium]